MKDCLFCKIIKGEIPSKKIFEDELITVFLDINPHTNGEALIVPKKHCLDYHDIDEKLNHHINEVIIKLDKLYHDKMHSQGLTILHNSGIGQEIKHYHIHFIPRYTFDDINLINHDELNDIETVYHQLTED